MFQAKFHMLRTGVKNIYAHKLRSALTVTGIIFGVGSVIVMLAIAEGARAKAVKQIEELGANNIIIRSVRPQAGAHSVLGGGGVHYGLTHEDLNRLKATLAPVGLIVASREHRNEVRFQDRVMSARIVAVPNHYPELGNLDVQQGRFFTPMDDSRRLPVAVLTTDCVKHLFPMENPLGKSVRIDENKYFQVIGILEPRDPLSGVGDGVPAQDYNQDVYIPFETDRVRFSRGVVWDRTQMQQAEIVEISQITLSVYDLRKLRKAADIVRSVLRENHDKDDTVVTVPLELLQKAEEAHRTFTMVLAAIASISLLVGGIGIMNIMLATVSERTKEIGIRRALGAKRKDIARQFLLESLILSTTGGAVGILMGIGVSSGINQILMIGTISRPWAIVVACLISIIVGLIFGLYPARRAARLHPIEALRDE